MLVLGRKLGERIVVGEDVVVTILGVRGHQVRVGIDAPRAVSVLRGELHAPPAQVGAASRAALLRARLGSAGLP
jgi:carbon storage regulator